MDHFRCGKPEEQLQNRGLVGCGGPVEWSGSLLVSAVEITAVREKNSVTLLVPYISTHTHTHTHRPLS